MASKRKLIGGPQLGLFGDKRDVLVLRKQERDPAKRDKVGFRLPAGGKIGEDIKSFFALAEGEEERYVMPVSESAPSLSLFRVG